MLHTSDIPSGEWDWRYWGIDEIFLVILRLGICTPLSCFRGKYLLALYFTSLRLFLGKHFGGILKIYVDLCFPEKINYFQEGPTTPDWENLQCSVSDGDSICQASHILISTWNGVSFLLR